MQNGAQCWMIGRILYLAVPTSRLYYFRDWILCSDDCWLVQTWQILCGLKTILTDVNILNSYRHIRPKKDQALHLTSKTIFDYRKCSLVNVYYFTLSKFKSNCVWKNWNNLGPLCLTNMTHAKVLALIPRWLKLQLLPQPIQLPPQLPLLPHLPLQLPK